MLLLLTNVERTVRTMISENSTKKTQARAFSWFAFFGNLGIFFGKSSLKAKNIDSTY